MIIIKFGKWDTSSKRFFKYKRIVRIRGRYFWTPFCRITLRRDSLKAYLMERLFKKELEGCGNVIGIQEQSGNWNYDPYMHGMLNGMLLIEHIFTRRFQKRDMPDYVDAPKKWLREENNLFKQLKLKEG